MARRLCVSSNLYYSFPALIVISLINISNNKNQTNREMISNAQSKRAGLFKSKKIRNNYDPELDDELNRYIISQNYKKSKSYYIEQAIKMYIHQDEKVLAKQIEDSIKFNIKTFEDRYCRILAKGVKRIYANTKILLNMLAYMSNSENDARFLLETLNEAEIDGYKALKNGIIERDIEDLFPKEELINKANKKSKEVNND